MKSPTPNVAMKLLSAARAHTAAVVARLGKRGYANFPFASASMLWLLDETGMRSTLLAQRAGVSKQAMSQLVRVMQQEGYLEQLVDPTDTRAKVIKMTARGVAVKAACVEVRDELNRQIVDAIGARQARELEGYLEAMNRVSVEDVSGPLLAEGTTLPKKGRA